MKYPFLKLLIFGLVGTIFFALPLGAQSQKFILSELEDTSEMTEKELEAAKARLKTLREYQKLIDVAKNAGFNDEELRKISVERDGETIFLLEFIEAEVRQMQKDKKEKEEASKKRYITVKDITEDLNLKESDQISNLRDTLIFSGEEE